MVNTSLDKLEPGDCTPNKQTGKMSKALKEAYDIAEERHDLDYFKNMLDDRAQPLQIPGLKKHKSIDGLFKPQRTSLAELDPNSFTPSPS
ncbi:hypothetical protein KCU78_g10898, partial [Aureobasidium melanogenum]